MGNKPKPERVAELAEMLEHMEEPERDRLLASLAAQEPGLAEELRQGLFPFADLARIEAVHLRELIGQIDRPMLALALRSITPELQATVLAAMPARAAAALLDEVQALGPRKLSEVRSAQRRIGELARDLERAGKIWRT